MSTQIADGIELTLAFGERPPAQAVLILGGLLIQERAKNRTPAAPAGQASIDVEVMGTKLGVHYSQAGPGQSADIKQVFVGATDITDLIQEICFSATASAGCSEEWRRSYQSVIQRIARAVWVALPSRSA